MAEATFVWKPLHCLSKNFDGNIAVIKLNTPFRNAADVCIFQHLWKHAVVRACTDGAANIVYDCQSTDMQLPTLISGDFDSLRCDVRNYYDNMGVEIVSTPDQDATDFTKCLQLVVERLQRSETKVEYIVAHDSCEGRLDHVMANIGTLFQAPGLTSIPLYLVSGESLSCLLRPGRNAIEVNDERCGRWCSLVPIGQPCPRVTTTGLKYNVTDGCLEFGQLISTSNDFDGSPVVTVDAVTPLLWSMGVGDGRRTCSF